MTASWLMGHQGAQMRTRQGDNRANYSFSLPPILRDGKE